MKLFEKFKQQNNKGMTIATVIVGIGFVLVLVSVLLTSTAINFKMRSMNEFSKDSFYSAEQVLDEINVNLQQMVSDGLSNAYSNMLSGYDTDELSASAKNEAVKGEFYSYIQENLALDTANNQYMVMPVSDGAAKEGLYGLLKSSTKWHENGTKESYGAFLRSAALSDGSFQKGTSSDGTEYYTGKMLLTNSDGIYLKDLVVYYRDSNGFVSTIRTDIHILFPEFAFSDTGVPNINSYCLITDTCLEEKGSGGNKLVLEGDSFAYSVDTKGVNLDYKATGNNVDTHIVADTIKIKSGSLTTYDTTNLWVGDVVAESSDVTYAGNTYVLDDTNMTGKNGKLVIGGYYMGYGNSTDKKRESSAILINGTGVTIDMQYVKGFTLAGRGFVNIYSDDYSDEIFPDAEKHGKKHNIHSYVGEKGKQGGIQIEVDDEEVNKSKNNMDVLTGESIAIKSNQLMYMVPSECIAVDENNESMFDRGNPLSINDYHTFSLEKVNRPEIQEIALNKPVAKLGSSANTLGEYLDASEPFRQVYIRSSQNVSDGLVYYYMNFKDEEAANTYFAKYYNLNKDAVDKYMSIYLDAIKFPEGDGASLRVSMAANAVEDVADERQVAPYIKVPGQAGEDGKLIPVSESFQRDYDTLYSQFAGYCTKLSPDIQGLQDAGVETRYPGDDNKKLFENIVDEGMLKEITKGSKETFSSDGKDRVTLVYRDSVESEYTLTSSDVKCNLIVANCSVVVPAGTRFEGIIIAKGKIIISGGADTSFKASSKKVDECLALKSEDDVYMVAEVFKDSDELSFMAITKGESGSVGVTELVQFSNWTKNVTIEKN